MKRTLLILLAALLALPITASAAGGKNQKKHRNANADCGLARLLEQVPSQNLDAREARDLLYMREEEKLARDVYLSLYDEWGLRTFSNIAKAEKNHMAAVLVLIDKYDLDDPVGDNAVGVFDNADLQQLYEDLFAAGTGSRVSALKVGAGIEELDIFDLQRALEATNNEDVQMLYQNLIKGSSNHLRAFARQLERSGVSYSPVYLTPAEYQEILDAPKLKGVIDSDGDLVCGSYKF
jgi:hypothetical protein